MMFFENLLNSNGFKILLVTICLDTIFGILRALKQKKLNSSIGIDRNNKEMWNDCCNNIY